MDLERVGQVIFRIWILDGWMYNLRRIQNYVDICNKSEYTLYESRRKYYRMRNIDVADT